MCFDSRCILKQDVIESLLELGARTGVGNKFGFQPLHQITGFGDLALLERLRELAPLDMLAVTSQSQTSLHVAASRYHYNIILELLKVPGLAAMRDVYGRTAFEYACLHRFFFTFAPPDFPWSATDCDVSTKAIQEKRTTPFVRKPSGWRQETHAEATCDFDIRSDLSADEFMRQYLSVQRPVLVRNHHRSSPQWEKLRKNMKKTTFLQLFGDLPIDRVTIPYAGIFGLEVNSTTLREFVKQIDVPTRNGDPGYIFEEPPSELTSHFVMPRIHILCPRVVDVMHEFLGVATFHADAGLAGDSRFVSRQFYLGPKGSGAPMHFHSYDL
eukprot:m.391818 g.391818  ORF g.391818 m.391818 type:complete len:327 (+) comp56346_c0_seq58:716-1696(+)